MVLALGSMLIIAGASIPESLDQWMGRVVGATLVGLAATLHTKGLRAALEYCCGGRALGFVPGKRIRGLRFEATDMKWSAGGGALVSEPAEAILMAVTNWAVALPDLSGDGVKMLANRIS